MSRTRQRTPLALRGLVIALPLLLAASACAGDGVDDDAAGGADGSTDGGTEEAAGAETADAEADAAAAGDAVAVEMVVFNPPSLGAFLPAVIEERGIDVENGVDIQFVERPPDAYNTEFASGQYPLGGSAALLSEGLRVTRGVDVAYLFNVFDFFGTVVSTTPDITSLADLPGHSLAAASATTNFAMFQWFAQQQGVDLSSVTVQNTATPGLVTQALTGRSDAVQLWEPAYSTLLAQGGDDLTTLDMGFDAWEESFGFSDIPYLGVAAHRSWIDENEEVVPQLRATYEQAAEWILANPEEAAEIIAATIPEGDPAVIAELIADNDRLGLNVQAAGEVADAIRAVFEAGMEIDYFESMPEDSVIYEGS